jgi:hypothetical protein
MDVYSFLAVKYIIDTYGYEKLNLLLRASDEFETILQTGREDFNSRWNEYIKSYKE